MTLTSRPLAILVVTIFFGGILLSSEMGWWQTESNKQAIVFASGEFAGQANPADIRGSYTFGDVEKNFSISAALIAQAFGVETGSPSQIQVKTLEELYADSPNEVGTASVRLFVAFYLGLPFDLSTDIYLPQSAVTLLKERSLTPEQQSYLAAHTTPDLNPAAQPVEPASPAETENPAVEPAPAAEHNSGSPPATLVRGKTTFAELLALGLIAGQIEQITGLPIPAATGMTLKDFCSENGLAFETIKPALQAAVDQLK
jgi:hypothetical protein